MDGVICHFTYYLHAYYARCIIHLVLLMLVFVASLFSSITTILHNMITCIETIAETHEALHEAILSRNTEEVDRLLGQGLSPCYKDYKVNCFHLALDVDKLLYLKKFLRCQPAAVNCRDEHGNTLLIRANKRKYFRLLAQYNPDPHLRNNQGDNVLLHAFKTQANLDGVLLCCILDTGVDIDSKDARGKTALEYAMKNMPVGLIEIFVQREAMLPPADENGQTILMRVVKECRHSILHVLGSLVPRVATDMFARDNEGRTAMHHAVLSLKHCNRSPQELLKITKLLFQNGCPLDCTDLKFEFQICNVGNVFPIMSGVLLPDNVVKYDVLSLFAQNFDHVSSEFFFNEWKPQNKYVQGDAISPVTTFLLHSVTWPLYEGLVLRRHTVAHCLRKFLEHDVTLSQHVLRFRNKIARMWSDELNLPDTLWLYFLAFCKIRGVKNFLHTLLRTTWPHHPLCLLLFPQSSEIWRVHPHTSLENKQITPDRLVEELALIGGPMLPNSRLYHAVRGRLETLDPYHQPALEKFIQIHDGVQSLRQLCRTNVRALFAEQAASGVDLTKIVSELCIPIELKNYLNFH